LVILRPAPEAALPTQAVCRAIAAKHYLTVREEDYERAAACRHADTHRQAPGGAKSGALEAHFPAQQGAARNGRDANKTTQAETNISFVPIPACRGDYL